MGRHIGGVVSYVAVGQALGLAPALSAAGLAADSVICAIYFTISWLSRGMPSDLAGDFGAAVRDIGRPKACCVA